MPWKELWPHYRCKRCDTDYGGKTLDGKAPACSRCGEPMTRLRCKHLNVRSRTGQGAGDPTKAVCCDCIAYVEWREPK